MTGIERSTELIEQVLRQIDEEPNLGKLSKTVYHDDKIIYIDFFHPETGLIEKTLKIEYNEG